MQDIRVNQYITAITKEAEEQRSRILKEQESQINAALAEAETQARRQYESALARADAELRVEVGTQVSSGKLENRKALLRRREEMLEEVLAAVREKLKAFAASDAYLSFLRQSASVAEPGSTLYLRPEDQPLAAAVSAAAGGAAVETDPSIALGGLKWTSPDGMRRADDTLDARLEEGRSWFAAHSGLTL